MTHTMTRSEFLHLFAYLLLEIFNRDPFCTDNERNKENRVHQHGHIFVLL